TGSAQAGAVPNLVVIGGTVPGSYVYAAGVHLAAAMTLALVCCVRIAHLQRLALRTRVSTLDAKAAVAKTWVAWSCAAGVGLSFAMFIAGTVAGGRGSATGAEGGVWLRDHGRMEQVHM
ncbi:unnamed protein product, partial [Chrysoparadoxa australica]